MRKVILFSCTFLLLCIIASPGFAAYHHQGENDSSNFLTVYPDKASTKLDSCALCHCGGEVPNNKGGTDLVGSCQWCHYAYGYDGLGPDGQGGNILETLNAYGLDYGVNGKDADAISAIENDDSDGDGYSNVTEIEATRYPGDATDDPTKTPAPYKVYTRAQLEAMTQHTQFLLMNTSRSGDFYAEYTGVPMKDLLDDAGILPNATGITVFAPDGWSQYHPLEYSEDLEMYHVYGNMPDQDYQYPPATYYYNTQADTALNVDYGWCDYIAPSCVGRAHGDSIFVDGGLKAILALKREGANLEPGVLTDDNKLDGEGPFRVVVPQKSQNAPDQSSKSDQQDVVWPYVYDWDHNAGACTRSVTIIRVEPLPEGTTDINLLEAGWAYIDEDDSSNDKIVIYGAIDGGTAVGEDDPDQTGDSGGGGGGCFIFSAQKEECALFAALILGGILLLAGISVSRKTTRTR